jgi:hypothetical protein
MLARNLIEMKKTGRLHSLGENFGLEQITRAARSSETQWLPVDDLVMSCPGTATKISGQEQSL